MIVKIFDNGWGPEYPAKQLENCLLQTWMQQLNLSAEKIVVINSVWYSGDYHQQQVLPFLQNNSVDRIVLIAMLDFAIPKPDWFTEYAQVTAIGYYENSTFVDYWALFLDKEFQEPNLASLLRVDCINHAYMCLNRKPHWHRRRLYQQLEFLQLLDQGLVSLGGDHAAAIKTLNEDVPVVNLAPNSGADQNGIPNDISSLGTIENWQSCFLNIVTETVYGIDQHYFVSEKIYKPILGLRPFLVYDVNGGTKWLTDRGFEVYTTEFSDITDLDLADSNNIPEFLKILCVQPKSYWQHRFLSIKDKLLYNRCHFKNYVDKQRERLSQNII